MKPDRADPRDAAGHGPSRRQALATIAAAGTGALMARPASAVQATPAGPMPGAGVCTIVPDVTEGPYYVDPGLVRADITEGRAGVPVTVRLQVVDRQCRPISRARVDIWHCDAAGLYSGCPGQGDDPARPTSTRGESFLRGTQFAGADGIVDFRTIYPGWYRGRTTHIHFKVFLTAATVLTGQLFLPDALSAFIHANVPPYDARAERRDTLNDRDAIARQATHASFAHVKEEADRYLVSLIVGVDPAARSVGGAPPGGPGFGFPPPGGPPPGGPMGGPPGAAGRTGSLVPGVDGIN